MEFTLVEIAAMYFAISFMSTKVSPQSSTFFFCVFYRRFPYLARQRGKERGSFVCVVKVFFPFLRRGERGELLTHIGGRGWIFPSIHSAIAIIFIRFAFTYMGESNIWGYGNRQRESLLLLLLFFRFLSGRSPSVHEWCGIRQFFLPLPPWLPLNFSREGEEEETKIWVITFFSPPSPSPNWPASKGKKRTGNTHAGWILAGKRRRRGRLILREITATEILFFPPEKDH